MTKNKDWTGNKASVFVCNGATGHSIEDREVNDYYATDPVSAKLLLEIEPELSNIWECAVGGGALANVFEDSGKLAMASDLIDRGWRPRNSKILCGTLDFMQCHKKWHGDIVTNPPYKIAQEWAEHSLDIMQEGRLLCLFLKLTFLEGKARKEMFKKHPPRTVWVSSSRISCYKNGDFEKYQSSATAYAWFVWQKGYQGDTVIKWFN